MNKKNIAFISVFLFLVMAAKFIISGGDQLYFQDLGYIDKSILILGVGGGITFWLMMLGDFFTNNDVSHKLVWGMCLIFLSWAAALLYFVKIFLPKYRGKKMTSRQIR